MSNCNSQRASKQGGTSPRFVLSRACDASRGDLTSAMRWTYIPPYMCMLLAAGNKSRAAGQQQWPAGPHPTCFLELSFTGISTPASHPSSPPLAPDQAPSPGTHRGRSTKLHPARLRQGSRERASCMEGVEGVEGSSESLPAGFSAGERAAVPDATCSTQGGPTREISYPSEIAHAGRDRFPRWAGRQVRGADNAGRLFQNGRLPASYYDCCCWRSSKV
jgi:hypothetical protein